MAQEEAFEGVQLALDRQASVPAGVVEAVEPAAAWEFVERSHPVAEEANNRGALRMLEGACTVALLAALVVESTPSAALRECPEAAVAVAERTASGALRYTVCNLRPA